MRKLATILLLIISITIGLIGLILIFATPPAYRNLDFETISNGHYSWWKTESNLVIKSRQEWQKVWNDTVGPAVYSEPLPEIDFSKNSVIAVFMGECPTSGYSIEIKEIREFPEKVEVIVVKSKPRPGYGVLQVLTHPYHIVKTKRLEKPVIFTVIRSFHT